MCTFFAISINVSTSLLFICLLLKKEPKVYNTRFKPMGLYPEGGMGGGRLITGEVLAFGITWAYNRGGGSLYPGFYGTTNMF